MDSDIGAMVRVGIEDLEIIRNSIRQPVLKKTIKRILGREYTKDIIFWPAGMVLFGLSEYLMAMRNKDGKVASETAQIAMKYLTDYFDYWEKAVDKRVMHVDDAIAGRALVNLFLITEDEKYKYFSDIIINFLLEYEKDINGSIIYNAKAGNGYIFADGAGQSAAFLIKYGEVFDREDLIVFGIRQLDNYYNMGMGEKNILPYHAFSAYDMRKMGLIGWGRAVGWLMMGYSELKACKDFSQYSCIRQQYVGFVDNILAYQRDDGGFGWMLQAMEGEGDTSASAMIGYSIAKGICDSILKETKYVDAVNNIARYIDAYTADGSVKQCLGDCVDLAMHPQVYGHHPCAQGATLAFYSNRQMIDVSGYIQ